MISPEERWTTLLALTCSMVFFLGHPGNSHELPEVPAEDAPQEDWDEYLIKIDDYIRAAQQRKRSDSPKTYDRFAEAEKRINSPHKYIPVVIKKTRSNTYSFGEKVKRFPGILPIGVKVKWFSTPSPCGVKVKNKIIDDCPPTKIDNHDPPPEDDLW